MTTQSILDVLEASAAGKNGVTFFFAGQSVAGIVTEVIDGEVVVARSETYSRIVIRLDQVVAVAVG